MPACGQRLATGRGHRGQRRWSSRGGRGPQRLSRRAAAASALALGGRPLAPAAWIRLAPRGVSALGAGVGRAVGSPPGPPPAPPVE